MPRKQQRRVADDDDDIEEGSSQPGPSRDPKARGGKKSAPADDGEEEEGREQVRHVAANDDDDEEDEEEDARIQKEMNDLIDNFTDQPLPPDQAKKVRGAIGEWDLVNQKLVDGFARFNATASLVEETQKEDSKDAKKLDDALRELLDTQAEIEANKATLTTLYQAIAASKHQGNAADAYEKDTKKLLSEYRNKTTRQKYASNPHYHEFREYIWEARHPAQPMNPLQQTIPREDGDGDDEEDDILIGGATHDYKCPLTLKLLEDPVTSEKCKHSFSREAIHSLFANDRTTRCPATGCRAELTKADLKANKDLAQRVKVYARRLREREQQNAQEAEEVIFDEDD